MAYLEELLPEFRNGAKIRRQVWNKGEFIRKDDRDKHFYDENNKDYRLLGDDFESDDWELYQESEPDWDSIIKNKCLCWFWDNPEEDDIQHASFLKRVGEDGLFENCKGYKWKNCRPVHRDEVTFYEDRKYE